MRVRLWLRYASDRAGFMEAPQIGPANIASSRTTEPMAMPANSPCSFGPVETPMMTSMRKKVRITSRTKDCTAAPAGSVAPSSASAGNRRRSVRLANKAPVNWLPM